MTTIYTDGGRKAEGYKTKHGDCFTRALAIFLNIPYKKARKIITDGVKNFKQKYYHPERRCNPDTGITFDIATYILLKLKAKCVWNTALCTHFLPRILIPQNTLDKVPKKGKFLVVIHSHCFVVKNGVAYDSNSIANDDNQIVYALWRK